MLLAVVGGLVVAGEGNEAPKPQAERKEDLGGCVDPGLGVGQLLHLWGTVGGGKPVGTGWVNPRWESQALRSAGGGGPERGRNRSVAHSQPGQARGSNPVLLAPPVPCQILSR